jgi:hypothetical protein
MDSLFQLLKEHGLTSERSLARNLSQLGRDHLRILLKDLATYQPAAQALRPGTLTFFPAGGRLGLGTAERTARGLLLLADHIVLPNDLAPQARELLGKLEQGKDLSQVKGLLDGSIHPYLYQYLRLQPLFQEGLASLAAMPSAPTNLVHPLANGLKRDFLQWVEHGTTQAGKPWMVLRVAPNYWSDFNGIRAGTTRLIPAKPLTSTDDLISLEGGFKPGGPGVRQLDPVELLSGAHPLAEAYEEFISIELFRVQMLAEAANGLNASLVTDIDTDWDIIRLLTTRTETAEPVDYATELVESLGESLSFIERVPLGELVKLRMERSAEFDSFRAVLFQVSRALAQEADPERRYRAARLAVVQEIQPRFAEYNAKMTALAGERGFALATGAAAPFIIMMFALLGSALLGIEASPTATAGTALASAVPYIKRVLEAHRQLGAAQGDPMFFLWTLKQAAK